MYQSIAHQRLNLAFLCVLLSLFIAMFMRSALANEDALQLLVQKQFSEYATGPHIEVFLLSDYERVSPGQDFNLGILFKPEEQWHTYWRNPGDSGEAPTIRWQSEAELSFGEIQWPIPKPIPVAHLVNYGYESENLLIVPVTLAETAAPGESITITADVSWLVCKEDCIPGWATLSIKLNVAENSEMSVFHSAFEATQQRWPENDVKPASFEIREDAIVFEIQNVAGEQWQLFPFRSDLIQHASEQTLIQADSDDNVLRIIAARSDYFNGDADTLDLLLSDGNTGFYVLAKNNLNTLSTSESGQSTSLWLYMLMAFAGGLILNLMPCVLPIISIKAMALSHSKEASAHKFAYLFGVLACFNAFALLIVLLQAGGQQVGWGFHMQSPWVVVLLAFLFTYIALSLLDAVSSSSRFANIGNSLASGDSAVSHFATGALAVIVASPCTAPFMAAALGIALVSEPYVTFVLFNALALGFALPLTLLFVSSKVNALMPKPGAWMQTFKHALAFPMFATVAWLCWVYSGQVGAQAQFALLIMLVLFCMFAWLLGQTTQSLFKGLLSLALVGSFVFPLWLSTNMPTSGDKASPLSASYIVYDQTQLDKLKQNNEIVVVNMTADWCITCKVNEQVAFSSDEVESALIQEGVNYMVGDWTNKNDRILRYLKQYERAGVPLYVVYAGNQSKEVLPQILSPNMIIDAINRAKEEIQNDE